MVHDQSSRRLQSTITHLVSPLGIAVVAATLPLFSTPAFADAPLCNGLPATIYVQDGVIVGGPQDGQTYAGTLNGTSGDDVIAGTSGNDLLAGNGGADTICGGDGTDTVQGQDVDTDWSLNAGTVTADDGVATSTITETEVLLGGPACDSFAVNGSNTMALKGGAGDDQFHLGDNTASVTGTIEGGPGVDTLDYSGRGAPVTVGLLASAVADGYSGVTTAVSGGFDTIDDVVGGSGTDTLIGEQRTGMWTLDSTNTYNDGAVTNNLTFTRMESLVGAASTDTFTVKTNAAFAGSIDGTTGNDILSFDGNANNLVVNVTGTNAGSAGFSFTSIESLLGGLGDDTIKLTSSSAKITGTIDGGPGSNTIDYTGSALGLRIDLGAGTATQAGGISHIQNVTGGGGSDVLIGDSSANVLSGGGGNDILVGKGGTDLFSGGDGKDFLIGGDGGDAVDGNGSDDLLVSGRTSYDGNTTALNAIMAEWNRTDISYTNRIAHIHGDASGGLNGSYKLTSVTVQDDGGTDNLTGGNGTDLFYASVGDSTDAVTGEAVVGL